MKKLLVILLLVLLAGRTINMARTDGGSNKGIVAAAQKVTVAPTKAAAPAAKASDLSANIGKAAMPVATQPATTWFNTQPQNNGIMGNLNNYTAAYQQQLAAQQAAERARQISVMLAPAQTQQKAMSLMPGYMPQQDTFSPYPAGPANNTAPWVEALYGPGAMAGIGGVPAINPNLIPGYVPPAPQGYVDWIDALMNGDGGYAPPSGGGQGGGTYQIPPQYGDSGYNSYYDNPNTVPSYDFGLGSKTRGPLINWTI